MPFSNASDIGDYYRAITMLEKVMAGDGERKWLLKMPDQPAATQNLIYLGCNILKTLHLVQTLTMLLDSLGVEYTAVGGPAFCCGIVHRRAGNIAAGERMFNRSQDEFAGFKPRTLINWCPSCEERLDELVPDLSVLPYDVMHFTQFLSGLLDTVQWKRAVPLKCALHAHYGSDNSDRETAFAQQILRAIPGLELVELSSYPELGAHCSAARVSGLGRPKFRERIEAQVSEAQSLSVQALVSVYHSCHRELARYAEGKLEVLNYTTLLARALDLPEPEDRYQRYLNQEFEAVTAELLPMAEAEGIRRDIAERVLRAEFATR